MPDEVVPPPAAEVYEYAIEAATPATEQVIQNAIVAYDTPTIANAFNTLTVAGGTTGSISLATTAIQYTEALVQYGILRKRQDRVELIFDMKNERVPVTGYNVYSGSSATNYHTGENSRLPDLSEKIESMIFWVRGDNLCVKIIARDAQDYAIRYMVAPEPVFFAHNMDDFPIEQTVDVGDTHVNSREVMIRHLHMFNAKGLDRAEVEAALIDLYLKYTSKQPPEWFQNITFLEKIVYATSPLLREIGSETVLFNCCNTRERVAYGEESSWEKPALKYTYKELCQNLIGTDSPSILKGVWDILFRGEEFRAYRYENSGQFTIPEMKKYMESIMERESRKKYDNENGSVWLGNRSIAWPVLALIRAVYLTFGVDHARNVCLTLKKSLDVAAEIRMSGKTPPCPIAMATGGVTDADYIARIMKGMSRFCSVQKVLKGILGGDTQWMKDGLRMYDEYSDPAKIPQKIRANYPNGLEPPKSWSSFREWHDKVSKTYHLIADEAKNAPFEDYPEYFNLLDGMKRDNWEIMIAREAKHLVAWGRDLKLCVGSYSDRVKRKSAFMVAFKVDGKEQYVMHLDWPTLVGYIERGELSRKVRHVFGWAAGSDDRILPELGDENGVMRPIDCAVEANVEFKFDGNKVPKEEEYKIAHEMVAEWITIARELWLEKEKADAEARKNQGSAALPDVPASLPELALAGRGTENGHGTHLDDGRRGPDRVPGDENLQGEAGAGTVPDAAGLLHGLELAEGPRPEDDAGAAHAPAG